MLFGDWFLLLLGFTPLVLFLFGGLFVFQELRVDGYGIVLEVEDCYRRGVFLAYNVGVILFILQLEINIVNLLRPSEVLPKCKSIPYLWLIDLLLSYLLLSKY